MEKGSFLSASGFKSARKEFRGWNDWISSPIQGSGDFVRNPLHRDPFSWSGLGLYVDLELHEGNPSTFQHSELNAHPTSRNGSEERDDQPGIEKSSSSSQHEVSETFEQDLEKCTDDSLRNCANHGDEGEGCSTSQHKFTSDPSIQEKDLDEGDKQPASGVLQQNYECNDKQLADVDKCWTSQHKEFICDPLFLLENVRENQFEKDEGEGCSTSQQKFTSDPSVQEKDLGESDKQPASGVLQQNPECNDKQLADVHKCWTSQHKEFVSDPLFSVQEKDLEESDKQPASGVHQQNQECNDKQLADVDKCWTSQHKEFVSDPLFSVQEKDLDESDKQPASGVLQQNQECNDKQLADVDKCWTSQHKEFDSDPLFSVQEKDLDESDKQPAGGVLQQNPECNDKQLADVDKCWTSQHKEFVSDPLFLLENDREDQFEKDEKCWTSHQKEFDTQDYHNQSGNGENCGKSLNEDMIGDLLLKQNYSQDFDNQLQACEKSGAWQEPYKDWSKFSWPDWGEPLPPEDMDEECSLGGENEQLGFPLTEIDGIECSLEVGKEQISFPHKGIDVECSPSVEKEEELRKVATTPDATPCVEANILQEERETHSFSYLQSSDDDLEMGIDQVTGLCKFSHVSMLAAASAVNETCNSANPSDDYHQPLESKRKPNCGTFTREPGKQVTDFFDASLALEKLSVQVEKLYALLDSPRGTHEREGSSWTWKTEFSKDSLRFRMKRIKLDFPIDADNEVLDRPPAKRLYKSLRTLL